MRAKRMAWLGGVVLVVGIGAPWAAVNLQEPIKKALAPKLDVPYVPMPEPIVAKMMEMAAVKPGDVVYDLGCGDGRIVITAASKFGARGVGVDIDPQRIKESKANAKEAGVADKATFMIKDLFEMDFRNADFLTLYLLPAVNEKLRPQILEMKPGSRIVSHAFSMGDWEADEEVTMDPGGQTIYFWVVPAKVEGSHSVKVQGKGGKAQEARLDLKQKYQKVTGTAAIGGKKVEIADGRLRGRALSFTADGHKYTATIGGEEGDAVAGSKDDAATGSARPAGEKEKGKNGTSKQAEPKDDAPAAEGGSRPDGC